MKYKDVLVIGLVLSVAGVIFVLASSIPGVQYPYHRLAVSRMRFLGFVLIGLGLFFVIGAIKNR